jgi:hypothetical protein
MHHIYSTLALDIARDRTREAARWRLVEEARCRRPSARIVDRLRILFARRENQPLPRPTLTSDTADCA